MWESAGIVISVAFSMVLVIYRSSRPHIDILGRLPGSTTYRSVRRQPSPAPAAA
jgi:SulP family sulfate permease